MSGVKPRHFCVTGFRYQVRHCVWTLTFLTTSPRLEIKHLDLSEQQRGIEPTCQESGTLTMRPPPGHGNLNNRICMLSRPRLDHAVILSSAVYRINLQAAIGFFLSELFVSSSAGVNSKLVTTRWAFLPRVRCICFHNHGLHKLSDVTL
uniref:Uncharacterized protein n=1 Tax=Timema bartmani TaxID=61472 RepID=A0A7R9HWN0_9NEOP|nr:unnamed protein product [Timema bartmani]